MTDRQTALIRGTFDKWPDGLRAWFDGTHLHDKASFAASLIAVDPLGWPCTSLLSVGEIVVPDSHGARFALWPHSRAAQALAAGGNALLEFVFEHAWYQVRLGVSAPRRRDTMTLTVFDAVLEAGQWQRVDYAQLVAGVTFELLEPARAAVLARWDAQIRAMFAHN
ncbi:hypothetical protein KQH49_12210 [Mycetohabitans sp. B5]|uniref:Uncharacterized protein n=1 Tax=Mycetohabitans endofungorum TaxID=417203 RepID=A0A2P5KCT7_9BURK|nr:MULTISPECIES: hypothetical protein [Mycetohabitans]MCG1055648.1 hypothetical protein [Mycetohabitans sp. B5]PPB84512.1 hypothetical protein B0O95_103203 [Mycetohabitans endofungorum]